MKRRLFDLMTYCIEAADLPWRPVNFMGAPTGRKLVLPLGPTSKRAKVKAARKAHVAMLRRCRRARKLTEAQG